MFSKKPPKINHRLDMAHKTTEKKGIFTTNHTNPFSAGAERVSVVSELMIKKAATGIL